MDKQKQINEIKETLPCIEVVRDLYDDFSLSEWLYDRGIRKIPENSVVVVFKKEQYTDENGSKTIVVSNLKEQFAKEYDFELAQIRKETAEKFAEMAFNRFSRLYQYNLDWKVDNDEARALFDEICKEISEGKNAKKE